MTENTDRPSIENIKSCLELERWYWLRSELVAYAALLNIPSNCQKPELTKRIGQWLDTGKITKASPKITLSTFDWRKEELSLDTLITDNYSNTQNVRKFMQHNASEKFKFSNEFMEWMRTHNGKTLQDAVQFWLELDNKKRNRGYREKALPQNQYNQFTRTLSEKFPGISAAEIKRIWSVKRSGPGPHVYQAGDENL